jgi:hypothetical protein
MKTENSALTLKIAGSQQRNRWFLIALAIVGLLSVIVALTFVRNNASLPTNARSKEGQLETASTKVLPSVTQPSQKTLGASREKTNPKQTTAGYTELEKGAKALINDQEYGAIARQFLNESNSDSSNVGATQQLTAAIDQKVRSLDVALDDAFRLHNSMLLDRITHSRFFDDYAQYHLPQWSWSVTAVISDYISTVQRLKSSVARGTLEDELDALSAIRKITSLPHHDLRIAELENGLGEKKKKQLHDEFAALLAEKEHQKIVEKARGLNDRLSSDKFLRDIVNQAEAALEQAMFQVSFNSAKKATQNDNWRQALKILQGIPEHQQNAETKNLATTARNIIDLQNTLSKLLASPQRLVDPSVAGYAKNQINEAVIYLNYSPKLTDTIGDLKEALSSAHLLVELEILSDNVARIFISGQGYVNPTNQKTIKLPRKKHRMIIRCSGQNDILRDVDLSGSKAETQVQIRLECER